MKLEQISQVIEIANTGSFSQAAKNLFIAQPSLSRSIKNLEQEVGFPIFLRKKDGVVPTVEGLNLIAQMRLIDRECQELSEMLQYKTKPHRPQMRIACMHNCATASLPQIYQKYTDTPFSSVMLDCANLQDIIRLVANCRVDYAVIRTLSYHLKNVRSMLQNRDIEYHSFARSKIYAAAGFKNPLYKQKTTVLLEDLYPYTIVSYADTAGNNGCNYSAALGLDSHARGVMYTNNSVLFLQLLGETAAIGLVATPPDVFQKIHGDDGIKLTRCAT